MTDHSHQTTGFGRFARFFLANLLGVTIDMALALGLIKVAGVSTTMAAAISITLAAAVMYFVHELWTFAGFNEGFSGKRLIAVIASAFIGLATRVSVIFVLQQLPFEGAYVQYLHLLIAVGSSFCVNFILVKSIIERKGRTSPPRIR